MYKLDLEKAEKPGIKLPTMLDHRKSKRIPEKTSTAASLTRVKPLNVDHNKLENSYRDRNTRPPYLSPEKPVCQSRSNS